MERLQLEHDQVVRTNGALIDACAVGDAAVCLVRRYEECWGALRAVEGGIAYAHFPFPVFFPAHLPPAPMHITYERVFAFVVGAARDAVDREQGKARSKRARVMAEIKRWHPDKFATEVVPRVNEGDRGMLKEAAKAVVRCLNDMKDDPRVLRG
ncbi:uncharacterized protein BXZ73DRAFT_55360 [Epithele typhae]|uniref:uncharacterized protein n=1 Tax=Epithele typhae TaxID=378194 RepID=UPI00200765E9|nr:uncharacterized protein BXZ73DRAFT_55360 [Epithele typhae]KAH9913821.1 hypothetical protein BXZ73DRAFT_55360 [Epithele typhae]